MANKKWLVRHKAQNIASIIETLEFLRSHLRSAIIIGDDKATERTLEQCRALRTEISELGPQDPEVISEVFKILTENRQAGWELLLGRDAIPGLFPTSKPIKRPKCKQEAVARQ